MDKKLKNTKVGLWITLSF